MLQRGVLLQQAVLQRGLLRCNTRTACCVYQCGSHLQAAAALAHEATSSADAELAFCAHWAVLRFHAKPVAPQVATQRNATQHAAFAPRSASEKANGGSGKGGHGLI
jgi:hypothetical protein